MISNQHISPKIHNVLKLEAQNPKNIRTATSDYILDLHKQNHVQFYWHDMNSVVATFDDSDT